MQNIKGKYRNRSVGMDLKSLRALCLFLEFRSTFSEFNNLLSRQPTHIKVYIFVYSWMSINFIVLTICFLYTFFYVLIMLYFMKVFFVLYESRFVMFRIEIGQEDFCYLLFSTKQLINKIKVILLFL